MAVTGLFGVATAVGYSQVSAADSLDGYPPLVQTIAEAFNLDPDEVENVIDQDREDREQEHLDALVEDGTLTEEQRAELENMHDTMRDRREELRDTDMTPEGRHEAMEELRAEMDTWAEENGIDLPHLGPRRGMGIGGGMGERHMHREMEEVETGTE